jgi:putative membrane protein
MQFLTRLLIGALSLGIAASVVPGIHIDTPLTLVLAAFLLGLVNAIIRPILVILTLPITILSLGLFLLVINALLFLLVAKVLPGFHVSGFGAALLGWLVMSVISWAASAIFTK